MKNILLIFTLLGTSSIFCAESSSSRSSSSTSYSESSSSGTSEISFTGPFTEIPLTGGFLFKSPFDLPTEAPPYAKYWDKNAIPYMEKMYETSLCKTGDLIKLIANYLCVSAEQFNKNSNELLTRTRLRLDQENFEELKKLIEAGELNVNHQDDDGDTALNNLSCRYFSPERNYIMKLLLSHDANPNIKNNKGRAPLTIASSIGFVDIVELLLQYKTDSEIIDNALRYARVNLSNGVRPGKMEEFKKIIELLEEAKNHRLK